MARIRAINLTQGPCFGVVETGGRFVEQQQAGAGSQGAGDFDPLHQTVGQGTHRLPGSIRQIAQLQRFARPFPQPSFLASHAGQAGAAVSRPVLARRWQTDHDVLDHGHVEEQLQVLEGAGDTQRGDTVRRQAAQFVTVEADRAGRRSIKPHRDC